MKQTELITNSDNSVFHLHLIGEDIANRIIIVGDPGRVELVSSYFDTIRIRKSNREFHTVTGTFKGKEITVISSGIGTDNIDILVNELDAAVNYDLETKTRKTEHRTLTMVRLGTSGGLQADIEPGSFLVSEKAIGFDNVMNFYSGIAGITHREIEDSLMAHIGWNERLSYPYVVDPDQELFNRFKSLGLNSGMTVSAPGFYAPQGRYLSLEPGISNINDSLESFRYRSMRICNYEMESSAIYGLSKMLGHKALTICSVIGNRVSGKFLNNYSDSIRELTMLVLTAI